jgi:hypothetical protein
MKLKERMPLWIWALLISALIIVPVLVCIQLFGVADLSFFGVAFLGLFNWAGADVLNGIVITALAVLVFGSLGYYIKGFKGIKTPINQYLPQGQAVTTSAEESKTVVTQ